MHDEGYEPAWVDAVVVAERPRLSSFGEEMKEAIATAGIPRGVINIKAKTNEGMGFEGRGEGISAHAVCLLQKNSKPI
jgi:2-C-methyl-D-erythritol 2,4-cyclodiphosphate synthase